MIPRLFLLLILLMLLSANASADTTLTYVGTNVPIAIPDGPSGIVNTSLNIPHSELILDVNVIVTITHPFDGDLRLYLEGPYVDDDVVRLADRCGQSGNNYISTVFDDEADTPICDGSPPFTGRFIPDQALSLFDHRSAAGTWIFRVTDNAASDEGTIEAWAMEVTYAALPARDAPPLITLFEVGQNYPNPFNPVTSLPITLTRPAEITVQVSNTLGQTVYSSVMSLTAGRHDVMLDGSGWSSGNYFARVWNGTEEKRVRMLLLK
ncbi:MAG: proprotein convertase P-domain-containing protein [Calditrichaeota bacterium]|nr:proprotein convertase P-domain-containing protein [Calditrichota bacterium]